MAGTFSITAPGNNVVLAGGDRRASVTYTVTNTSGKDLRGRAMLATAPANAPHLAWLAIEGESERPFGINATEQYRVTVLAPADAPPGNYTIRLNMLATYNPDETFTEGPTVLLTVPAPTPTPRKFPLWTIPVALVVLAVIAVAVVLATRPRTVTVPDVAGMVVEDALDELEALGLRPRPAPEGPEFSSVAEGRVARTDPAAESEVEPESRITWYLSAGLEPTPTPVPTPTATPVPDIVDSFTPYEDDRYTLRYPPDWLVVTCGFCAGEGGSIYALALAGNEAMRTSLTPIFATGDLGPIDYGEDGAMFVLLQAPDFNGDPLELITELIDGADIDLLEINDYETLRAPAEVTLNGRPAATATIRGLDTASNRLLVFSPWVIQVAPSSVLVVYAAAPIDRFAAMEPLWDGILRTLEPK